MLDLIPMNEEQFFRYRRYAVENYAAENVKAGRVKPESSAEDAERAFSLLLPEGIETRDHFIYNAFDGEERVGAVWLSLRKAGEMVWVYELIVHEEYRRRGYGAKILRAIEQRARELGVERIGLQVFGHNTAATELYEKAGYETTSLIMTRFL